MAIYIFALQDTLSETFSYSYTDTSFLNFTHRTTEAFNMVMPEALHHYVRSV